MKIGRGRRWALAIACLLGGLVLVALIAAPAIARTILLGRLRAMGFVSPQLTVQRISPRGIVASEISLGRPSRLGAGSIEASYTIGDLRDGRVGTIVISGGRWQVQIDEAGTVDLGLPDALLQPGDPGAAPAALPFDRVELRDVTIELLWPAMRLVVQTSGTITAQRDGRVHLELAAELPGDVELPGGAAHAVDATAAVTGSLDRAAEAADLEIAVEAAALRLQSGARTIELGQPSLRAAARASWSGEAVALQLDDPASLSIGGAAFGTAGTAGALRFAIEQRSPLRYHPGGRLSGAFGIAAQAPVSVDAAGVEVSIGRLEGTVELDGALADAAFHVEMEQATVHSERLGITGETIAATADRAAAAPAARIELAVARGTIGALPVVDAALTATASIGTITVDEASWSMEAYGRFAVEPFAFETAEPRIEAALQARDVGFGEWLSRLTGGRATGSGSLRGHVTLGVHPGRPGQKLFIRSGLLEAHPPTGWIEVDDAARLEELLERSDPRFATDERLRVVKERLVAALMDYAYTMLRIEFIPEGQTLLCRLVTAGHGRFGEDPQEIGELIVNIHDFDAALYEVLAIRAAFERAGEDGQ